MENIIILQFGFCLLLYWDALLLLQPYLKIMILEKNFLWPQLVLDLFILLLNFANLFTILLNGFVIFGTFLVRKIIQQINIFIFYKFHQSMLIYIYIYY